MQAMLASVASRHLGHEALLRDGGKRILVARAHVGHVHAQNPEQAVAFAVAQFA